MGRENDYVVLYLALVKKAPAGREISLTGNPITEGWHHSQMAVFN